MNNQTPLSIQLTSLSRHFYGLFDREKKRVSNVILFLLSLVLLLVSIPRKAHATSGTFMTNTTLTEDITTIDAKTLSIPGDSRLTATAAKINLRESKVTPSDAAENAFWASSRSVSISGNHAILGAPGDDDAGESSGSAYIFARDAGSGTWAQVAKITASDAEERDRFGGSVSISGNYAIVGAIYGDKAGIDSGSAYIFERDTGSGTWAQMAKITASDAEERDRFGGSVSISGNYAIVGADGDDNAFQLAGAAYIFERDTISSTWAQVAKITASDAKERGFFGTSVSISGDHAIVGTAGEFDFNTNGYESGYGYIFEREMISGIWSQVAKITTSDVDELDAFGTTVSISDNHAIVGTWADDEGSGSAYIFVRDTGSGTWSKVVNITTSNANERGSFGSSVFVSGDQFIVASPGSASAYIYDIITDNDSPVFENVSDLTEKAMGPDGAIVEYPLPRVMDDTDPNPTVTCEPASGSLFALGATKVTCVAIDSDGNEATTSFTVHVIPETDAPLTFTPIADATIKLDSPTENFGAVNKLNADMNPVHDFLMKFDVSGIEMRSVQSATLRLFCTNKSDLGGDFQSVDNDWSEDTVTWDNAPHVDVEVIASLGPVARFTWVEVDLTSLITEDGTYSLRVMSPSRDGVDYRSKEKPEFAPELVITFRDTLTFTPTADATIKRGSPAENFGMVNAVRTGNRPLEDFLMKFDVSGIGTRSVKSATLRLFCTNKSDLGGEFHQTDIDWSEDTVTWDTAPLADRKMIASLGPVVRFTWAEVDLTSLITEDGIYSLRVMSPSDDGAVFRSKEKPGLEPELILTLE